MADISKIKLPSGNEYDIKDAVARQMIAGGVSFNIVWTATEYASTSAPNAAKLATIPAGVNVYYNNGAAHATGTLAASDDTIGKFYLIYSKTQAGTLDAFDEYATIGESTKTWEKIGDTLIDLSGLVTDVTLNKQTDSAIGVDATFTVTQPTVVLATDTTSGTGKVQVATGASGTTKYIGATATGGGAAWASKDTKTVVTSVTASTSNLATSSVTGVQAATTTASKATAAASQITANGSGTATTENTDWLKGVSVANEVLTIGAAAMDTQATTQYTFVDVTVPIKNTATTTVATGQLVATGGGATIATNVSIGSSVDVIGSNATLTNTQPTIALAQNDSTATGRVGVITDVSANTTYIKASAANGSVAWNNKDAITVLTSNTSITVTKGE